MAKTGKEDKFKEYRQFKKEVSVQWIKGSSGNTYLCPTSSLSHVDQNDEIELKKICVDESNNPQND